MKSLKTRADKFHSVMEQVNRKQDELEVKEQKLLPYRKELDELKDEIVEMRKELGEALNESGEGKINNGSYTITKKELTSVLLTGEDDWYKKWVRKQRGIKIGDYIQTKESIKRNPLKKLIEKKLLMGKKVSKAKIDTTYTISYSKKK